MTLTPSRSTNCCSMEPATCPWIGYTEPPATSLKTSWSGQWLWNRCTHLPNLKVKTSLPGQWLWNRCTHLPNLKVETSSGQWLWNRSNTLTQPQGEDILGRFCVWEVIGFVDWLDERFIYEKRFDMYICLWPEFDSPEVTHCGWQDNKIQLLTHLQNLKVKTSWSGRCLWTETHILTK